jgi:sulfur carrier protein ThiS
MTVKLVLRDKEVEVKPGMTLLDSLKKAGILPESVIATRGGEMILEDEILKDGEVIKLIAVISGGDDIGYSIIECPIYPAGTMSNIQYQGSYEM